VSQNSKLHFELTPANNKRLEAYIDSYNRNPGRVTPKIKTADVVNQAMDTWLSGHEPGATPRKDDDGVKEE